MPVGPAPAPATDRTAAPGYVAEPVATPTTPRVYLSDCQPGCGHQLWISSSVATCSAGGVGSTSPMSTNSTSPARAAPGPTTSPGLRQPNVTVTSPGIAPPSTAPGSAPTPDGTPPATTRAQPPPSFAVPP